MYTTIPENNEFAGINKAMTRPQQTWQNTITGTGSRACTISVQRLYLIPTAQRNAFIRMTDFVVVTVLAHPSFSTPSPETRWGGAVLPTTLHDLQTCCFRIHDLVSYVVLLL